MNDVIFIGFADNKVPEFKEIPSKDYILFGDKNLFPDHLLYLYNKSSVHGAIINNKVKYIIGKGIDCTDPKLKSVNRYSESLNKVLEKSSKDIELFGGFYWQIIYNALGNVQEIIHSPFQELRKSKDGKGYYHCKNWDWNKHKKTEPVFIPNFDPKSPVGTQIFSYREYRPGASEYPLPGYFSALNDIETDAEISIYNLSVIKNGQFSGKIVSFFNGVPSEEEQDKLEKRWNKKFAGAGNAGKTMLSFNLIAGKEPTISDLSTTDLDKLFDQLSKTTQAKIFAGHEVTSPTLFGIMEPGKLGGRNEMQDSYEIFKNTYANSKQQNLEEVLSVFLPLLGLPVQKISPVEPISGAADTSNPTNDAVKNMTGRQYQHMNRIITKYKKGSLDKNSAALILKNSFGFGDDEIEVLLSNDEQFSAFSEEDVAEMFAACGQDKDEFAIVKSKPFEDEERMEFIDVKGIDASIIDLIRKDKRITPEVIASTLEVEKSYVDARMKTLTEKGVLKPSTSVIGVDTIIEHSVVTEVLDTVERPETIDIFIKYTYEPRPGLDPVIETTRPFCRKLIKLNRVYSRAEIENISQRVGYSVWDRRGGFWGNKPECRHIWKKLIVVKKRK
jgi:hypothetical protein